MAMSGMTRHPPCGFRQKFVSCAMWVWNICGPTVEKTNPVLVVQNALRESTRRERPQRKRKRPSIPSPSWVVFCGVAERKLLVDSRALMAFSTQERNQLTPHSNFSLPLSSLSVSLSLFSYGTAHNRYTMTTFMMVFPDWLVCWNLFHLLGKKIGCLFRHGKHHYYRTLVLHRKVVATTQQ